MTSRGVAIVLLVGCAQAGPVGDVGADPDEIPGDPDKNDDQPPGGTPSPTVTIDVQCATDPDVGDPEGFRHFSSRALAFASDSNHRGIDLVATASTAAQIIEGDASYGTLDLALEDEDVELFACRTGAWTSIGRARTDDDGHFALSLSGAARLPLGMRDMFASVVGDRTGARFVALVANNAAAVAVTDIDGTLTSSEFAFTGAVIGLDVAIHDGAPQAFRSLAERGYQPIYVTARPGMFTDTTREWVATKGLPRGPLRLPRHTILPGNATTDFKAATFASFGDVDIAFANGNRESDVQAYQRAGVPADRTFVKLPEYDDELAPHVAAGEAIGFEDYSELRAIVEKLPVR